MRTFSSLVLVALASASAAGQGAPVFKTSARIDSVVFGDGTIRLGLSVQNSHSSTVSLWGVIVDAPSRVTRIDAPLSTPGIPDADWFRQTDRQGRSVAEWFLVAENEFAPGARTPTLSFEALGVATLVSYHAVYHAPPPKTDNPDEELPRDQALQRSVPGTIVGIGPGPSAMSPIDLVSRLTLFLNRSCGELAWIDNRGVCQSLGAKLNAARASISANDRSATQGQLKALLNELEAQHGDQPGQHVTTSAYALLRSNALYLLSRL